MRLLKFSLSVFFIALLCLPASAQKEIQWSATEKLKWSDFDGRAPRSGGADAVTQAAMGFDFETLGFNHFKFILDLHFEPKESWVKKGKETDYLLAHEQLHFDIHEIFARRFMKRAITKNYFARDDFSNKLSKLFNDVFKELTDYQYRYDEETNHSRNREAQVEWNEKVKRDLKEMEDWQDRTHTFKL